MSQVSDKYTNETGMRSVDFEGRYFPSYVTWLEKCVEGARERAPNTGTRPKLPPQKSFGDYCDSLGLTTYQQFELYAWLGRQLRAGA